MVKQTGSQTAWRDCVPKELQTFRAMAPPLPRSGARRTQRARPGPARRPDVSPSCSAPAARRAGRRGDSDGTDPTGVPAPQSCASSTMRLSCTGPRLSNLSSREDLAVPAGPARDGPGVVEDVPAFGISCSAPALSSQTRSGPAGGAGALPSGPKAAHDGPTGSHAPTHLTLSLTRRSDCRLRGGWGLDYSVD